MRRDWLPATGPLSITHPRMTLLEAAQKPPLAVDLDGTLMRGDIFTEAMMRFVARNPFNLFALIGWLMRGRAFAKAKLAVVAPCDPRRLPYNAAFVAWLRNERAHGRTLVLATASDQRDAKAVAAHVGLFHAVYASDGVTNLKSARKAEALVRAFPDGFAYAGNESADLKVWRAAKAAVVVNATAGVAGRAAIESEIETIHAPAESQFGALIRAMRPHQWVKNALVFVPMIAGQGWLDTAAWANAAVAFWALSFAASAIYLLNDAADIDADRLHPRKQHRPFASGALPLLLGVPAAFALAVTGLALGAAVGALWLIALYLALSTLYTFWLKTKRLADIFMLTGLYIVRVIVGGVVTGFIASSWLLAFCGFFFLSLALAKRVSEIEGADTSHAIGANRRGYIAADSAMLKMMGVSAGFLSCLVLALYIQNDMAGASHYRWPLALWVLPASVLFWFSRLWLLVDRREIEDDPLVFAFRDWVSLSLGAFCAAAMAFAALA